ncbi:MAG TPA: rhodanese-like domain-containing protein [Parachlamydiaceae bacterium]|nr:rhodanese-like domain-containing protein [Parachlamydiaceae bacterium]
MLIRSFFTPGLFINSYLIFDEETKRAAVVDPTRQIEIYLAQALQNKVVITDIIETHVHADFVSGAAELKAALEGKPVIHCSGLGGEEWIPAYADHVVQNRDTFNLGSIRLEALHTPGHTPEHLIWVVYDEKRSPTVPELAFTGDLLFVGSVGRPDLLGEEAREVLAKQLYRSLFAVLYALPDFLEIYPAHGGGSLCGKSIGMKLTTTLGYEKKCNPWLIPQDYRRWLDSLELNSLPIPDYFARMKQINVKGIDENRSRELPPVLTVEQARKSLAADFVADLRRPEDFAAGNIKGSINIPVTLSFTLWAGVFLPADRDIVLVVDNLDDVPGVVQLLNFVGLDRISGVIDVGHWKIGDRTELLKPSPMMDVGTLQAENKNVYLLDVRNDQEWDSGHIEGAHHLELIKVPQALNEIPLDKPIAVICHSGNRASIIASLIERERGGEVFNVKGGMEAWHKVKYPVKIS